MDIDGLRGSPSSKAGVLQCSRSCLSAPFWCPSQDSRSVVGEGDDEEDIFVTFTTLPLVEQFLGQRTSQRGLLWLPAVQQDQSSIRFSYRLLDCFIHCSLPGKRPKLGALKKNRIYDYTRAVLCCTLAVPSKTFQLVKRVHRTVVPQLNRLHEDVGRYPGLVKQTDAAKSASYLQAAGVAVWPSRMGLMLSTLSGTRALQALIRLNLEKGRLELCLINHTVVGIRVAWVDTLSQALHALRQFAQGKTDLQAASPAHSALMCRPTDLGAPDADIPAALRRALRGSKEPTALQKLVKEMSNKAKGSADVRDIWVERGVLKLLVQLCHSLDPYRQAGQAAVLGPLRALLQQLLKGCPPFSSALHQFLGACMTCLTAQQPPLDRSHTPLLDVLFKLVQELPALAELSASYGVFQWAEAALLELLRAGHEAHSRRMAAHARAADEMRNDAHAQFPGGTLSVDEELSAPAWGLRRNLSAASASSETNLYLLGAHASDTHQSDTDKVGTTPSKRPAIVPRLSLTSLPHQPSAPGSRSSRRLLPMDGYRGRLGPEHSPKDFSPHPSAAVREVRRLAASVGENMVAANFAAFLVAKRNATSGATVSSSGHLALEDESPRSPNQPLGEWQQPWVYRTKSLLLSLLLSLTPYVPACASESDRPLTMHLVADLLLPLSVRGQLLQAGQQPGQQPLPSTQQKELLGQLQQLEAKLLYAQGQPPALALGQVKILPLSRDALLEDVRVLSLKLLSVRRPDERVYLEVCELLDVVRLGFDSCMAPSLLTRCLLLGSDVLPRVEHLLRSSGRMTLWRAGPLSLMSSLLRLYSSLAQRACSPNVSLLLVESLSGVLAGHDSAALQQEFAACLSAPSHLQQLLSPSQLQFLLVEVWQYFTHIMRLVHRQAPCQDHAHDTHSPMLPMSTRSDTLTGCSMEDGGVLPPGSWMTAATPNASGASSARRTSQTGTSFTGPANILAANGVNSTRSSPWEGLPLLLSPFLPLLEPGTGLASRQLQSLVSPTQSEPPSTTCEVNSAVLEFLESAFSIPGSPFLEDRRVIDHHINFHFLQFARQYQSLPLRPRRTSLQACIKHLKVLCALARHPSEVIRRRFYQLRILDFFLRELSLEAQLMSPHLPDARPYASPTAVPYPEEGIRAATAAPHLQPPPQPNPLNCSPSQSTPSMSMGAWASAASLSSSSTTFTSPAPSVVNSAPAGVITIDPTATTPIHQTLKVTPLSQLVDPLSCRSVTSLPLSAYLNPTSSIHSVAQSAAISPLMTAPPTPQLHRPYESPSPSNVSFASAAAATLSPPIPSFSPTISSSSPSNNPFQTPTPQSIRPLIPSLHLHTLGPLANPGPSPVPPLHFPKASLLPYQTPPPVPHPFDPPGPSRYTELNSPTSPQPTSHNAPMDYMTPDGKFKLGLDLDEDLDRLLELEAMGVNVALDGLSSVGSASSLHDSTESFSMPPSQPTSPIKRPRIIPPLRISSSAIKLPPGPVSEGISPVAPSGSVELPRATGGFRIPPLRFSGVLSNGTAPPHPSPAQGPSGRSNSPVSATNTPLLPAGSEVSAPLSSTNPSTNPSTSNPSTSTDSLPVVPLLPLSRLSRSASGHLDRANKGQQEGQAGGMSSSSRACSLGPDAKYEWERQQRGLYMDETLHLLVLQIVLELAFVNNKPDRRFFGVSGSDMSDDQSLQYRNCPLILHHHLSHPSQAPLLSPLQTLASSLGPCQRRLLRLTAPLLQRSLYGRLQSLARGASAQVYSTTARLGVATMPVAVKVVDLNNAPDNQFYKLFGEVSVMDHLSASPSALDLLDCGVYGDRFWMVTPLYRCSLRQWRSHQTGSVSSNLRLYLNIFQMVAMAVQEVAARGVVHFDVKGDNVLLEALPDVSEEEFWHPNRDVPPFRVVLADFGEAQVYTHREQAFTKESRGTEVFKSPEMLLLGFAHQKREHKNFDRRKHSGAGFPHDVWSLGCLLFELLSNRLLFVDGPQSNLTETAGLVSRVCYSDPSQPLLTPEESEAVDWLAVVHELLAFILVREPTRRPTTKHLVQKLQQVLNGALGDQKVSPHRGGHPLQHSIPRSSSLMSPLLQHHSLHQPSPTTSLAAPASSSLGLTPLSGLDTPGSGTAATGNWQLSQHVVLCSLEGASSTQALRSMQVARVVILTDAPQEELISDDWLAFNPLLQACAHMELPCVTANLHHAESQPQWSPPAHDPNHYGTLRPDSTTVHTWWDGDHHQPTDQHTPSPVKPLAPSKPIASALDDALQLVVLIVGQMVRQLGGAHVGNKCLDQLAPILPHAHAPRLAIVAPAKTVWALGALATGYLIHHFHLSPTRALMHLQLTAPQLLSDSEHEHHVHAWLSLLYTECVGPITHHPHSTTAAIPHFTCLCGTFQAALRTSRPDQPTPPTQRHCNLPLSDAPECFCNCAGVLEALARHHGCTLDSLQWITAPTQHVWISPMAPTRVWDGSGDATVAAPGWRLYTCGVCGCVVCAANSQDASSIQLVANWMDPG